ncbi:hypothetical protein [Novibacillus thermophilus]|uniref:Uncharacterized protein n=1 Tax=Novibacillus thermophilus TaxID=1471761 RepID=A0A1U9K6I7_9BACL|nr:hypothetical protein [Novibacillus thermophilus]AQS55675.1 hypothetical protein B0W44_07620 [Novibacillus thermophilus]
MCFTYTDKEKQERVELFREIIMRLEMARFDMYREYADLQSRLYGDPMLALQEHPMCEITTHTVGGKEILQFSYPGMLPLYTDEKDRDSTRYRQRVRDYYIRSTVQAANRKGLKKQYIPARVLIVHCFEDLTVRDLDNRNRSHIINGLRHAQVIGDDNWKELSLMEEAIKTKESSVEVFVGYSKDIHELMQLFRGLNTSKTG